MPAHTHKIGAIMPNELSERERIINMLPEIIGASPYGDYDFEAVADFIIADRARIVEELSKYVEHDSYCLCSQYRGGKPTEDGGYVTLFGHGSNEKWYQRNEYPECSCGLTKTLKRAGCE